MQRTQFRPAPRWASEAMFLTTSKGDPVPKAAESRPSNLVTSPGNGFANATAKRKAPTDPKEAATPTVGSHSVAGTSQIRVITNATRLEKEAPQRESDFEKRLRASSRRHIERYRRSKRASKDAANGVHVDPK